MDVLIFRKQSVEQCLYDESVFSDITGLCSEGVIGTLNENITSLINDSTTLPPRVNLHRPRISSPQLVCPYTVVVLVAGDKPRSSSQFQLGMGQRFVFDEFAAAAPTLANN